jgi:hypothetical protein
MLRMSEIESVKKRWLTVKSTVFYIKALEAIHSLILPKSAHIVITKDHGSFTWPRLSVGCLSCVWFCPSRLRKASGHGRVRDPLTVEAWPSLLTCANF